MRLHMSTRCRSVVRMTFILSITQTGTIDTARSSHDTIGDAHHALARFARSRDIHGYGTTGGTLTTRSGRVNQATHSWTIRETAGR